MQKHTIRRFTAEARAVHQKDSPALQQQLSYWIHAAAFKRQLEEVLDKLVSEEEYLQIDRLELNVSGQNETKFRSSFLFELKKAIGQLQVQQKLKTPLLSSVQQINKIEAVQEIALYFLSHGILPWNADQKKAEEVHHLIKQIPHSHDGIFLINVLEAGRSNAAIWRRIIYSIGIKEIKAFFLKRLKFSADFMEWVEQRRFENSGSSTTGINSLIKVFQEKETLFWQFVLQLVSEGKSESFIRKTLTAKRERELFDKNKHDKLFLKEEHLDLDNPTITSEPSGKEIFFAPKQHWIKEGCFVANAGLVLIWGELKSLFRRLGFVEDKEFRDKTVQQEAIVLLHYVTTGDLQVWEDQLLLNKVLCGWELDEPVDTTLVPGKNAQKAADMLLQAFLDDWMKGRKYSPPWLRHNFLRRSGLLSKTPEGSWQLKVEKKTEDVLLDILSPGFGHSVVKYPWMQHILFVHW